MAFVRKLGEGSFGQVSLFTKSDVDSLHLPVVEQVAVKMVEKAHE